MKQDILLELNPSQPPLDRGGADIALPLLRGSWRGFAQHEEYEIKKFQRKQSGFSTITAIFLVVVIAALAAFSVTLFTIQQRSAALDVLGERAYQAARAGIEWGAYQVLQNNSCAAGPVTVALPGTLASFTVQVSCTPTSALEGGVTVTIFQVISTAKQGTQGTPNYLERQMQVSIAK